jgi:hypothetical protein
MAAIPFTFECSREAGFVPDPNEHKRFGYVTELKAFATVFPKDLKVNVPLNPAAGPAFTGLKYTAAKPGGPPIGVADVVGVIERFEWNGGAGNPLELEFYVSQENAMQIKAAQQLALQTVKIEALAWWIGDFDQVDRVWFEQAFPMSGPITGIAAGKEHPEVDVDLNPVAAKDGIDVNVYKVTLGVAPAANMQYTLHFANSLQKKVVKSWGLPAVAS